MSFGGSIVAHFHVALVTPVIPRKLNLLSRESQVWKSRTLEEEHILELETYYYIVDLS